MSAGRPRTGTADVVGGRPRRPRPRAIGQAISAVERDADASGDPAARLPEDRPGAVIGVTGPPGAGKSTLVQRLAQAYRGSGRTVGDRRRRPLLAVHRRRDPRRPHPDGRDLHGPRASSSARWPRAGTLGGLARATQRRGRPPRRGGLRRRDLSRRSASDRTRSTSCAPPTRSRSCSSRASATTSRPSRPASSRSPTSSSSTRPTATGADRTVAELAMMLDFADHERLATPDRQDRRAAGEQASRRPCEALEAHGEALATSGRGAAARRVARGRASWRSWRAVSPDVEARAPEPDGLEAAVARVLERREDPYSAAARLFGRLVHEPDAAPASGAAGYADERLPDRPRGRRRGLDRGRARRLPGPRALGEPGGEVAAQQVTAPSCRWERAGWSCSSPTVAGFAGREVPGAARRRGSTTSASPSRTWRPPLADLKHRGFRLVNAAPCAGAGGKRVAFLHPAAGHGVLIELSREGRRGHEAGTRPGAPRWTPGEVLGNAAGHGPSGITVRGLSLDGFEGWLREIVPRGALSFPRPPSSSRYTASSACSPTRPPASSCPSRSASGGPWERTRGTT